MSYDGLLHDMFFHPIPLQDLMPSCCFPPDRLSVACQYHDAVDYVVALINHFVAESYLLKEKTDQYYYVAAKSFEKKRKMTNWCAKK